jgi:hypothetical protein
LAAPGPEARFDRSAPASQGIDHFGRDSVINGTPVLFDHE